MSLQQSLLDRSVESFDALKKKQGAAFNQIRLIKFLLSPSLLVIGVAGIWYAFQYQRPGKDIEPFFFSGAGIASLLCGLSCVLFTLLIWWLHMLHVENWVMSQTRALKLSQKFEANQNRNMWDHVEVRACGGLIGDGPETMPSAVQTELTVGAEQYLKISVVIGKALLNGTFFTFNILELPARSFEERLNLSKYVVSYIEFTVFCVALFAGIVSSLWLVVWMHRTNNTLQSFAVGNWAMTCTQAVSLAGSFSCLTLMAQMDPAMLLKTISDNFKKNKTLQKQRTEQIHWFWYVQQFFRMVVPHLIWRLILVCVSMIALTIKVNQVSFLVTKKDLEHNIGLYEISLLAGFANNLISIRNTQVEGLKLLEGFFADTTDKETYTSRFQIWQKHVIQDLIHRTDMMTGILMAATLDANDLARLLLDVRSLRVGDRVGADEDCAVPATTRGMLELLEPYPVVRWEGVTVAKVIELNGQSDSECNGLYDLHQKPDERQEHKYVRRGMPTIELIPRLGFDHYPTAIGWALLKGGKVVLRTRTFGSTFREGSLYSPTLVTERGFEWQERAPMSRMSCCRRWQRCELIVQPSGEHEPLLWRVSLSQIALIEPERYAGILD